MLRSTPPRGHTKPTGVGSRGALLFPSRSQPDLTLVGVKSKLSPRPFSAPHATPRGIGTRYPFTTVCYSDGHSVGSGSQGGASDTLSEAQESEEEEEEEQEMAKKGDTVLVKRAIPVALLGLHAQVSKDSALGSSIAGAPRLPPDDAHDSDLALDTPRTNEDTEQAKDEDEEEEEEENEDEDQSKREEKEHEEEKEMKKRDENVEVSEDEVEEDLEEEEQEEEEEEVEYVLGTPQPKEPDKERKPDQGSEKEEEKEEEEEEEEDTDEGLEEDTSVTKPDNPPLPPKSQPNPKPNQKTNPKQPLKPYQVPTNLKTTRPRRRTKTMTSTPTRPIPVTSLTPPPVRVTLDLGFNAKDDHEAGEVNVQEVIDERLLEAQGTGHLNLSNLGLPFFPSAVLLADASMIHRVSLQDNKLVDLPAASLSLLTHVTWLDLRYNLLAYLPQEISALVSLQVLLLQGNRLTALPTSLGMLPALVTLQVSDNPLTFPPETVIRGGAKSILQFLREVCAATTTSNICTTSSCESDFSTSTPVKIPVSTWDGTGGQMRHEHLIYDENVLSGVEDEGVTSDDSDGEDAGDLFRDTLVAAVGLGDTGGGSGMSASPGYLDCPPSPMPSLRVAIRTSRDSSPCQHYHQHQHHHEGLCLPLHSHLPDSDGDTLAPPASPVSPCLLTPNTDLPTRTTFDLTREGIEAYERELVMSLGLPGDVDIETLLGITRDGLEVLERLPDGEVKERLLRCLSQRNTLPEHFDGAMPEFGGQFAGQQPRRALHLHLQADYQQQYFEDDSESLQGDLGEGYRRPYSQVVEDEGDGQRKVSPLPLPVVSLQLPASGEAWSGGEEEDGRAGGRGRRRTHGSGKRIKRGSNRLHKPKLATVAEVHRRARDERRRQREMLAAAREMTEQQRLKSQEGLEVWRDETRLLQEQRALSPEGYLPAVCEAPFAVDGMMLTPRARSRLKSSGGIRSSLSPSVSEVCAGVRSCLEELNRTKTCSERRRAEGGGGGGKGEDGIDGEVGKGGDGGGKGRGGGGGGGGGRVVVGNSLAHPAAIVHQLHHLRRQLHRLKVNCVI
ncbi:uncharacterized protein LOC127010031 [Eriocheir sinensis]|uniref:uncharacterized protein LOC127010031 n=1 Tax=Eriocheir sinensis TaxID=95602 RepID=UPI0021C5AF30|nr:uncharacterized protein LOC127010031 [Eriocheir sinensis]